jgi:Zn-dependent protease with chaperone function
MGAISIRYAAARFSRAARGCVALSLACGVACGALAGEQRKAPWFPGESEIDRFSWAGHACEGCDALTPRPAWQAMAALSGLDGIRFLLAPDESHGPAWSYAPNAVVLAPSALKLPDCQLAFLVGHELVHLAQRHFDEDAHSLLVLSAKPANWTLAGETAMGLLDGDFSLALQMSAIWQQQEQEADWVGALLAAQACKCSLEKSALSYLNDDGQYGGGLAATHDTDAGRIDFLRPFADSARTLAGRTP